METALETKVAFGDMMQAFEAFREANDERLAQIEQRMAADVVTSDKVDRINRALDETKAKLDELTLKAKRPRFSDGGEAPAAQAEHKQAFEAYVRKGETQGLFALEARSMSVSSNADGGYLVPSETEAEIGRKLADVSPIRAIAGVRQVSSPVYKKPFALTGAAAGWVGETAARSETAAPTLAELQFPAMELYAMPAATQTLLDDSAVNLDEWIAEEVQQAFAEQESAAFVTGTGVNTPRGLSRLRQAGRRELGLGQPGLCGQRRCRRLSGKRPLRQAGGPRLCAEERLPPERALGDEPQDASDHPQVQGWRRQLPVAAGALGAGPCHADGLPHRRERGHARHRRRLPSPWPSATSTAAISSSTASACGCCAIPIRRSPMCSSTPPSGWAAGCRTSRPSS